ncbi:MAG: hypothetical protein JO022_11515, partial [Acidobacteriaceae bacterium]|nr:hypothetical protein [Acidobacteriaceae bacterium]
MSSLRLLRLMQASIVCVFLAFLVWGGYYVYEKGFGRRWRGLLAHEFKRFGLVINARRLTLDPFRGLIAQDVDIFQDEAMTNLLARVSNVSLDINYAALLQHEPALNAVDLRDAQLSIPLPGNGPDPLRLQVTGVQARIYFVPGRIEIRQLSGLALGIRCTASGTLVNPASYRPSYGGSPPVTGPSDRFLKGILTEIRQLHTTAGAPQLNFTFQGDMADLTSLRIQDGLFQGRRIQRLGYEFAEIRAAFQYEQQRLEVRRLLARDTRNGEALASGAWDFVSGRKTFNVRSNLDLAAFLGADPRCTWARDWTFQHGPQVEMAGDVRADGRVRYLGTVACGPFTCRGVSFQNLRANFSKDGTSWMITDAEVGHSTGTVTGEGLRRPGEFRVR